MQKKVGVRTGFVVSDFLYFVMSWSYALMLIIVGLMALVSVSCKIEIANGVLSQSCELAMESSTVLGETWLLSVLAVLQVVAGLFMIVPFTARMGVHLALCIFVAVIIQSLLAGRYDVVWINGIALVGLLFVAYMMQHRKRYHSASSM